MKGNEQMPIMDMNYEREGGASWCHMWHEMKEGDTVGPGSCSAAEGGPQSSSLSTMSIIDVGPLNLVVVHYHPSCTDRRPSSTTCPISASVLVLLPIQERLGWVDCWIRPINAILPYRCNAPITVLGPVRTRCRSVCVWVRCGETAISSRLLL